MLRTRHGFTLIELLIVVAIIAILALIAVPNFLEAQTRAKVVRIRSDFRSLLTALQAYRTDFNDYPDDNPRPGGGGGTSWYNDIIPLTYLTTPVAYITTVPTNPFYDLRVSRGPGESQGRGNYAYWGSDRHPEILPIYFHIVSCGPDSVSNGAGGKTGREVIDRLPSFINELYDPTNGTVSRGDLMMTDRGMIF